MNELDILRRFDALAEKRSRWEDLWRECQDYVLPEKGGVFDSTAPLALSRFAAALESVLTPRSQKWHSLKTGIEELDKQHDVTSYLEEVADALFRARYRPEANFANQINEVYLSLGVYGTAVLFIDDEVGRGLRYRCLPLSECFFAENRAGQVDTVFRQYKLTARQAVQEFGEENLPDDIRRDASEPRNQEKEHEFLHAVFPREDFELKAKTPQKMPVASYHLAKDKRKIVRESGYRVMPYAVTRYQTTAGDLYGRSPAMTVLADIKQVNEMEKTLMRAGQKAVDPPLLLPDDDVLNAFSLRAGALNYGGLDEQGRQRVQPLQLGARLDIGAEMLEQKRKVINDAFLVNLFMILVEAPTMTATEVMYRAQEKGQLLAPAMGRQQAELLAPIIRRELDILTSAGVIPEAPEALAAVDGEVTISYDAPLSRAQKGEEATAILNTFQAVAPLAQVDPNALAVFKISEAVRIMAAANGVPQKAIWTEEELQAKEAAAKEEAQMREQVQMMLEAVPAAAGAAESMARAESTMMGVNNA